MGITDKMKNAAMSAVINQALSYLEKDPEANLPKLMELVDKVVPGDWYVSQRGAVRKAIREKSNWYQLILKLYDLDPGVRKAFFQNFILNASLLGSATQDEVSRREGCNVPWAILMDPTSACNLHCTGCWAAEYGNKLNMSLETMDNIIRQGKELGTYMYIFSGGEPMVRKDDIIRLCETHPDCMFLAFTNGTLIDGKFAEEMLRVKNFVPAISVVGFEEPTPQQREKMVERIRGFRETKPIFALDFQNDGEFVKGCIAGGRRYLHINANGDMEPCAFIHYSDSSVYDKTLLEALKSPLFMAYHDGQPFNDNMLRPCPMLENPEKLRDMVKKSGAKSTDMQSPEDVDNLYGKCKPYADKWTSTADRLWSCSHSCASCQSCPSAGQK